MAVRTSLLILLALLALAPGAAAQADTPNARIEAALQRAREAGLPVALLESKINEGRAKSVAEARIAAAVEQRLESITRARAAMRQMQGVTPADISVGADALEAGIGEEVLVSLLRAAPADRRAVAVAVLTQLVHLGEAPGTALAQVRQVMLRDPGALQRLPAEVAAARQQRRETLQGIRQGAGGQPGAGRLRPGAGAPPDAAPAPRRPGGNVPRPPRTPRGDASS